MVTFSLAFSPYTNFKKPSLNMELGSIGAAGSFWTFAAFGAGSLGGRAALGGLGFFSFFSFFASLGGGAVILGLRGNAFPSSMFLCIGFDVGLEMHRATYFYLMVTQRWSAYLAAKRL